MTKENEKSECCAENTCCGCNCFDKKQISKFLKHIAEFFDKN